MMLHLGRSMAGGLVLLSAGLATPAVRAQAPVSLQKYAYQTVNTPPFNGQLAFYVGDVLPGDANVRILIGNGRRPFAVDAGSLSPAEFDRYIATLKRTGAVRVLPFQVRRKGQRMTFQYLSRSFTVAVVDLSAGRIVLTLASG